MDKKTFQMGTHFFSEFRILNRARANRWHNGNMYNWSITDWSNAMAGESGELCNAVKKLRRVQDEIKQYNESERLLDTEHKAIDAILEEAADTFIYLDLVCARLDRSLIHAIAKKFDETSEKYGFPEKVHG